MEKMNIKEFTDKVNKLLNSVEYKSSTISDMRFGEIISERRIRDYVSKGLIDKPIKVGKFAYYEEKHLNQLLNIRELQAKGLSDKSIFSLKYETKNQNNDDNKSIDSDVDNDLMNSIIGDIQNIKSNYQKTLNIAASSNSLSRQQAPLFKNLNYDYKYEIWHEYTLTEKIKVSVKAKSDLSPLDILHATKELENLLKNIKEDKND